MVKRPDTQLKMKTVQFMIDSLVIVHGRFCLSITPECPCSSMRLMCSDLHSLSTIGSRISSCQFSVLTSIINMLLLTSWTSQGLPSHSGGGGGWGQGEGVVACMRELSSKSSLPSSSDELEDTACFPPLVLPLKGKERKKNLNIMETAVVWPTVATHVTGYPSVWLRGGGGKHCVLCHTPLHTTDHISHVLKILLPPHPPLWANYTLRIMSPCLNFAVVLGLLQILHITAYIGMYHLLTSVSRWEGTYEQK